LSRNLPDPRPPRTPGDRSLGWDGWLTAPLVAILAVVCCAGPVLLAALLTTGAGTWLAAHGYTFGAWALIAAGAIVAWRITIGRRLPFHFRRLLGSSWKRIPPSRHTSTRSDL
jgi:hypothetical protein